MHTFAKVKVFKYADLKSAIVVELEWAKSIAPVGIPGRQCFLDRASSEAQNGKENVIDHFAFLRARI